MTDGTAWNFQYLSHLPRRKTAEDCREHMNNVLPFCRDVFPDGHELLIFVTVLIEDKLLQLKTVTLSVRILIGEVRS